MARRPTAATAQADAPAAPVANPTRGEYTLALAGETYRLRPSYSAIMTIERKCEVSLIELARDGAAGGLSLEQLGQIAATLIRAGGHNVADARIAELIYEEGMVGVSALLAACLIDAVTGGRDSSGELRPATVN